MPTFEGLKQFAIVALSYIGLTLFLWIYWSCECVIDAFKELKNWWDQ